MDISKITDIQKLESMAFRLVEVRDSATNDIQLIRQRLQQLADQSKTETEEKQDDPEKVDSSSDS